MQKKKIQLAIVCFRGFPLLCCCKKKKLEAAVKAALPHYVHVMLECLDGDKS
jgi:hypothetical protein